MKPPRVFVPARVFAPPRVFLLLLLGSIAVALLATIGAAGKPPDRKPPTVSVTSPTAGAVVSGTVTLSATAYDRVGVIQVKWFVDGREVASDADGAPWTRPWNSASVGDGSHQLHATAGDAAGNWGTSRTISVTVRNAGGGGGGGGDPVIAAAGDIASSGSGDEATARVLDAIAPTAVLTTGDNVYEDGLLSEFMAYYDPTWGRHRAITHPTPGNHDYHTPGAAGYFDYFGSAAGPRGKGFYSYDIGAWHLIALNSNISMSAGSEQETWLRQDLAANPGCTLAYWHHARFTSGNVHGNTTSTGPLWQALYDAGADVVLSSHNHQYERFAPQNPAGAADPVRGIREFVVGTGGAGLYGFGTPKPNSEVRYNASYGVLKLTLRPGGYDWKFEPVAGNTFTDVGSASCHAAEPTPNPPAPPPTLPSQYPVRGMYDRDFSATGFDHIAALGFNYIDSGPYREDLDPLLARGLKAFVWLGGYANTSCRFDHDDAWIRSHVGAVAGHAAIGAYFIDNEPDPYACPGVYEQMRARVRLVKSIDPRPATHIAIDSNSGAATLNQIPKWAGISDIVGLNPYPCYIGKPCDYAWITTVAQAADAAGLRYWGQVQSHGDDTWRQPTVEELHNLYQRWRTTKMEGYLVFAWHWPDGHPELWLANNPALQQQHAIENGQP